MNGSVTAALTMPLAFATWKAGGWDVAPNRMDALGPTIGFCHGYEPTKAGHYVKFKRSGASRITLGEARALASGRGDETHTKKAGGQPGAGTTPGSDVRRPRAPVPEPGGSSAMASRQAAAKPPGSGKVPTVSAKGDGKPAAPAKGKQPRTIPKVKSRYSASTAQSDPPQATGKEAATKPSKRRSAETAKGGPARKKKVSSTAGQAAQVARSVARANAEYRERSRGTRKEGEREKDEDSEETDTN